MTLTFDLLTLKVVSKSRVTWATSLPCVLDLGPMYATDRRQTSDRRQTASSLNAPPKGRGIIKRNAYADKGNKKSTYVDRGGSRRWIWEGANQGVWGTEIPQWG